MAVGTFFLIEHSMDGFFTLCDSLTFLSGRVEDFVDQARYTGKETSCHRLHTLITGQWSI